VAGESRERAIELAQRMEESGRFAQTNITGGRPTQATNGDTEQVDIMATYVPETMADTGPPKTEVRPRTQPPQGNKH